MAVDELLLDLVWPRSHCHRMKGGVIWPHAEVVA